jgi:multidrug efflux pump
MASSVTAPLERQCGQMPGLTQMTSTSAESCSIVTLQFTLDLDIDVAEQQVQAAINAAGSFLPRDLPNPPIYNKINPADAPVLTLAVASKTFNLSQVQDLADTRLAPKLSQVLGVGLVSIAGGTKPAVRVLVNPTAIAALGLNFDDIRAAIVQANVNQAKGSFDGRRQSHLIASNDQLLTSEQYRRQIIGFRNGSPVRLSDVATIVDAAENERLASWMNETPAVILNVHRQPGANTIDVVDRVKRLLPQLRESLPPGIEATILSDRTITIRASIRDVQKELLLTVVLVVLVIFLFLRRMSATFIPSVAVPLSLIGTLAAMYLLGYSLNNLTLMALTIATGFVVDDAIVMIENISRYIEKGESPMQAALKGAKEIGFTIISLSVSLIAVLIPLLFMGDVVGRLFREFAVTLSITIVVSAIVSLTLTPMMCARLLRHSPPESESWFSRMLERGHDAVLAGYAATLRIVLRHQTATLIVAIATLAATIHLYIIVPKGFFPVQDTGVLIGIAESAQDASFTAVAENQQALARVILADPAVESLSSFVGVDGTNTSVNSGRLQINLKPPEVRRIPADAVIARLQETASAVAGVTLFLQSVQDLTVETHISRTQFQMTMQSPDPAELDRWTPRMIEELQKEPALRDVASDRQNRGLQLKVEIDRDEAARLGVTMQMIDDTLYSAFGQRQISTMFTQLNQYRVVLAAAPGFTDHPEDLEKLYICPPGGGRVPFSAVAKFREVLAPLTIEKLGQFPVVTISFNLSPGASLGEAVAAIDSVKKRLEIPESIQTQFQGAAEAFRASLRNEPLLILAALVTVYIVLGVLYESFIHPITILSTLPSAGVGAILALMICRRELDVIGLIGIVLLIGIVKKNAIMMIDFALEAERTLGMKPDEAIYQASLLRFRPIMMTTLAALFGAVPLALGGGVGSELRQPLGITIIGGLLVSQVLTLYTTPVIYLAFDRLGRTLRGANRGTAP